MERFRGRWRVGAELVPVLLVIACVGGTLGLVMAMHRRVAVQSTPKPPAAVLVPPPASPQPPTPKRQSVALPSPPPLEDPTPKVLAELARQADEERSHAQRADRLTASIEQSVENAKRGSARWRLREALVRKQVDGLEQAAKRTAGEADKLDRLKDALETRLGLLKEDITKASSSTAVAILPYRGTNGTWRRPVCIECAGGGVQLQPGGPSFSLADLMAYERMGLSNPLVRAVARTVLSIDRQASPDGGSMVPYLMFLVRPDGIRAFYAARTLLEMIGVAFGYELVDQDAEFSYPDLNDPAEWRDALESPSLAARARDSVGSRELSPWPTNAPGQTQPASPDDRDSWPDRTPRSRMSGGRYSRSSPLPDQLDTRQLRGLSAGRLADPADAIPDDGRVEIFPGAQPPVPVLLPTPSSDSDHPGAPGFDERPRPVGRFQPLGPPSRSLPGSGRGGVGTSDAPAQFGSGSSGSPVQSASDGARRSLSAGALDGYGATRPEQSGNNASAESIGGTPMGSGSTPRQTSPNVANAAVAIGGDAAPGSPGSGAGLGRPAPFTARPGDGAAADSAPSVGGQGVTSGEQVDAASATRRNDDVITDLPPLTITLPPAHGSTAGSTPPAGSSNVQQTVVIPPSLEPTGSPGGSTSRSPNAGARGASGYGPASATSNAIPLETTNPSSVSSGQASGGQTSPASDPSQGDWQPTTPTPTLNSSDASSPATHRTDSVSSTKTSSSSQSTSQASSATGGMNGGPPGQKGGTPFVEPRIWIEPLKTVGEITIACGPKGVTIHPGGYRFKTQTLASADAALPRTLRAVDRSQRSAHPKQDVRPAIVFLIEPGGQPAYRAARRQLFLAGIDWPSKFRVLEGTPPRFFSRGEW